MLNLSSSSLKYLFFNHHQDIVGWRRKSKNRKGPKLYLLSEFYMHGGLALVVCFCHFCYRMMFDGPLIMSKNVSTCQKVSRLKNAFTSSFVYGLNQLTCRCFFSCLCVCVDSRVPQTERGYVCVCGCGCVCECGCGCVRQLTAIAW